MNQKSMIAWLEKQKEFIDKEDGDFTIYHPVKNGNGEYECIPYSFYGTLGSFSKDKDIMDFLRSSFYSAQECIEWIEKQGEQKPVEESWPNLSNCLHDCKNCTGRCIYRKEEYQNQKPDKVEPKFHEGEWITIKE